MSQIEFDRFEAWFRSTCTCLEAEDISERLKVDLQETVDTEGFVFENSETQHDWEVWQAAILSGQKAAGSDPADGAIDVAWLKEIGFVTGEDLPSARKTIGDITLGVCNGCFTINAAEIPRQPRTRGDVLRLLDVLGMTTKGE